jgi:hypothetical protein
MNAKAKGKAPTSKANLIDLEVFMRLGIAERLAGDQQLSALGG